MHKTHYIAVCISFSLLMRGELHPPEEIFLLDDERQRYTIERFDLLTLALCCAFFSVTRSTSWHFGLAYARPQSGIQCIHRSIISCRFSKVVLFLFGLGHFAEFSAILWMSFLRGSGMRQHIEPRLFPLFAILETYHSDSGAHIALA